MSARLSSLAFVVSCVAAGASAGCGQVDVYLTAYLSPKTPFPEPSGEDTIALVVTSSQEQALLEAEVAAKIATLLRQRGYRVAPADETAYLLACRFAIDAGRTATRTVAVHEPGRTYYSYTYGPRRAYYVRTTTLPGRTRYVPQRYTVYTRSLRLSLIKLEPAPQARRSELSGPTVWQCEAYSPGESTDLRWVLNHLLLAAFDHFGQDTGRQIRVSLPWKHERVEALAQMPRH